MLARHVGPSGTTRACPCEARAATRPALVARDQEPVADERAAASASAGPFVQANQFEADHQQHHRSSAEAAAALASASAALDYYRPGQSDLDGPPPSGPDLAAANRHHHHQRQQLNQALNIRPSSSSYSMSAANAASHQHLLSRLNAPGHLTFRPEAELGAHAGPPMRRDSLDQAANIYYRQSPPTTPNGSALAANGQDKSQEAFNLTSHKVSSSAAPFLQIAVRLIDLGPSPGAGGAVKLVMLLGMVSIWLGGLWRRRRRFHLGRRRCRRRRLSASVTQDVCRSARNQ